MVFLEPLLFSRAAGAQLLRGCERKAAEGIIRRCHYTHTVPSGKSYWFCFEAAIVVISIPANCNCSLVVLGRPGTVWELSRLWAPDGHDANLLTEAISKAVWSFRRLEPSVEALVSYADPNAGHSGGVYRAASWVHQGRSEENRVYLDGNGQSFSRRKFHSGERVMNKAEIEGLGFTQVRRAGKERFAFGLTNKTKKEILSRVK